MSNQIGKYLKLQLFGESHAFGLGAIIEGLPAGLEVDQEEITKQLRARQSSFDFNTPRKEDDDCIFVSGVYQGRTNGNPLALLIHNKQQHSADYDYYRRIMRSGHADYVAQTKYEGHNDHRGGGSFSGRLTAALVAAGAIAASLLRKKSILIGSHIQQLQLLQDKYKPEDLPALLQQNWSDNFVVYDAEIKQQILERIQVYSQQDDSLGAIVETNILNLPIGLGEPFFWGMEAAISQAIFSIPGIKALEFGDGFEIVHKSGSQVNDSLYYDEQKRVKTRTNHLGGINGGISNGMPLNFKTLVRPPASIAKLQHTIDLDSQKNITHIVKGRHDSFIANRTMVVIDNLTAFIILDLALAQFGKEWLK